MANSGFQRPVAVFSGGGTGGHLYPALALAEALSSLRPELRVLFLGARQGVEARILPERDLEHHLLPVRGFRRGKLFENLAVLWALVRSLFATGQLFSRVRPGIVVVTGGYAGGPAGIMAGVMGIPLALQEQNAYPGFTTRVLSRWCSQIHLAFPEAEELLPRRARSRAHLSGNPVRAVVRHPEDEARARFGIPQNTRVILVVGGSQGAAGINRAVLEMIRGVTEGTLDRPEDVRILWATGPKNLDGIQEDIATLGSPDWVHVLGYIKDMPEALSFAALAVSRAGAMSTSEFLAWGIPAVLIPLPTSAAHHQSRNAESLSRSGSALHIPESELTGDALWASVLDLLSKPESLDSMKRAALELGRPTASSTIARALETLLPSPIVGEFGQGGAA